MDRATKLIVVVWACAALCAQVWLLQGIWPRIEWLALGLVTLAAVATAFDRRAIAAVLSAQSYITSPTW